MATATATTKRCAYATLVTTEGFVTGARVLLSSLRATCKLADLPAATRPHILVLVTAAVPASARAALAPLCDEVREVEALANPFAEATHVPGWVDAGFTKLWIWALTEYERVAYVDADCLVLQDLGEVRGFECWQLVLRA